MQTMKFACRRKSTSQTISILRFSCQVHPSAKKNNGDQYRSLNDPSKFPFGLTDCIPQMCWQHMSELSLRTAQARSLLFLRPPKKTTKPTASTGLFLHDREKNPPDFPTRHRQQTPTDPISAESLIPGAARRKLTPKLFARLSGAVPARRARRRRREGGFPSCCCCCCYRMSGKRLIPAASPATPAALGARSPGSPRPRRNPGGSARRLQGSGLPRTPSALPRDAPRDAPPQPRNGGAWRRRRAGGVGPPMRRHKRGVCTKCGLCASPGGLAEDASILKLI